MTDPDERRQLEEAATVAAKRFEELLEAGVRGGSGALLGEIEELDAGEARLIVAAFAGNELMRRSGAPEMN